jgi:hypothetical protein
VGGLNDPDHLGFPLAAGLARREEIGAGQVGRRTRRRGIVTACESGGQGEEQKRNSRDRLNGS